jgi:hypothetical protein
VRLCHVCPPPPHVGSRKLTPKQKELLEALQAESEAAEAAAASDSSKKGILQETIDRIKKYMSAS